MQIGLIIRELYGVREEDIENALRIQKDIGGYLGQVLIQTGVINETQLIAALSGQLGLPVFSEEGKEIDSEAVSSFLYDKTDISYLIKNNFIPVEVDSVEKTITFVTNDPLKTSVLDYVSKRTGFSIRLSLAPEQAIKRLSKIYVLDVGGDFVSLDVSEDPERLKEMAFEAPVIKYLNNLVSRAVEMRASDIHIESAEKKYKIRLRIDGILHDIDSLEDVFAVAVVSRVKLLSGLDIAEKRLPQDGKFATRITSTTLDIRVSTMPMIKGEGVVLRLLYRERLTFDIAKLGLEPDHEKIVRDIITRPYGILLVTGPTGAGKTTTLYSVLTNLNKDEKKIITVEDPVEYQIGGINQIQVKAEIGLTFANALRSILRHDPDVIMVGEIRDRDTAEIAVQSALTGHLVFSTLHTNDAPGSLFRLVEMAVEDYLINASVIGVIAQRIVRKNCSYCSVKHAVPEDVLKEYNIYEIYEKHKDMLNGGMNFMRGTGCAKCAGTGYRGRIAIFELFDYTDEQKEVFLRAKSLESLKAALKQKSYFRQLREDGMLKVIKGITTVEEVLRVS